ncbi:Hypothetical predicted protein [Olea europaea subsp. europaea]|uniref:PORR domain-containing protein n=1 Tax=Olea europaea subsp. europaea TaxID=158383 RepID=A0A8S0Q3Y4_OLEEU|nr:Hypothetical predicted protein [Olea europaea subsp. europaea]
MWFGFTAFVDEFLREGKEIMNGLEREKVDVVGKLLMMSVNRRIPLSKIYHNKFSFRITEDFRGRVEKYLNYFQVVVEVDGKIVLELVNWDLTFEMSLVDEDKYTLQTLCLTARSFFHSFQVHLAIESEKFAK